MGYTVIGQQEGDSPKTPTLRQYLKKTGGVCSQSTVVSLIFKPGKFGGWSLNCDNKFRVEVLEDNPLYKYLNDHEEDLFVQGTSLVVLVTDTEKVQWQLAVQEEYEADWEAYKWGYKIRNHKKIKPSPTADKTARKSKTSGGELLA